MELEPYNNRGRSPQPTDVHGRLWKHHRRIGGRNQRPPHPSTRRKSMGLHSPCLSHGDHTPMHYSSTALTLRPLHSHYSAQENSSRRRRHAQRHSCDWHGKREAFRCERGMWWQSMWDEQQHHSACTAKSLDPPIRELLRMRDNRKKSCATHTQMCPNR